MALFFILGRVRNRTTGGRGSGARTGVVHTETGGAASVSRMGLLVGAPVNGGAMGAAGSGATTGVASTTGGTGRGGVTTGVGAEGDTMVVVTIAT
jgi:hypothetical protein